MKIAILGYAGQGQSSFEYWNKDGNEITVCDQNADTEIPKSAKSQIGDDYLKDLERFDLLIRTPALHPRDIVNANNSQILDKVWSNTNEFLKVCPTKNIIGVTGTKGKGTTSTLIAKMLEAAGHRVHLGGNIGTPPLDLLKNDISSDDWVVLELANFQLIDLKNSPPIAVCLMVEHEHMDWHEDMEEYIAAKQQLFINQSENDVAIYYAKNENSQSIADASMGRQIPFMEKPGALVVTDSITIDERLVCRTDELKLLGEHNWQNACAAVTAVWQVTKDIDAIKNTLTSFSGLPYRIEFRTEKEGIKFYNDSFATAPGASIAAIHSIVGPKVMIIGGHERGNDLTEWSNIIAQKNNEIRKVVLIGASAQRMAESLKTAGFHDFIMCDSKDMSEIVDYALKAASPGCSIVLSPGFASFGLFKNFEDRGNKFNEAVERL